VKCKFVYKYNSIAYDFICLIPKRSKTSFQRKWAVLFKPKTRRRLMNGKDPHESSQIDKNLGYRGWFVTEDLGRCAWTDGSVRRKGGKKKQNKPAAGWSCFFIKKLF
jgi:hypothetical protein